jgi:hypothetical protein
VAAVTVGVFATVLTTRFAADLEFVYSYPSKQDHLNDLPPFVKAYNQLYQFSWLSVGVAICWGAWLLRKPTTDIQNVVIYVLWLSNTALLWLLWTLLTLYMLNQTFAFVLQ